MSNSSGRKRFRFPTISSKIYLYAVYALVLLVVLYKIWPLPFQEASKRVLLPTVNVLAEMGQKVISPINTLRDLNRLDKKNKALEQENNELMAKVASQENTNKNCSLYLKEVGKGSPKNSIIAQVIGRTPGGLNSTLLLNKGSSDDIYVGDAVLSTGYFIGKVKSITDRTSEVMLIFSHNSFIPVVTNKNNDGGLLQGGLEGLTITDIPINSKAEVGDSVVTSGLGGELPAGLMVGKIGVHLGIKGDLFQKVKVESPINPYQINFVTVLNK
jgi:rod shape-determining protein MreC